MNEGIKVSRCPSHCLEYLQCFPDALNMHMRILVFGTFDHLHPGHRFLLSEASKRGDLSVVVARDVTVEKLKGKRSAQNEDERKAAIETAFPKASALLGDPTDYLIPIHSIKPDLILLGYDQELPPGVSIESLGCPVERLPAFEPEKYKSSILKKAEGKEE